MNKDIYGLLESWGAWAASDHSGVDWQPIAAGFKSLLPYGKNSRIQCNDDEGIMIDRCIALLKKHNPDGYKLVIAHFVVGISMRSIAKKMRCSDGKVRKELENVIGFVGGYISVLELN